MLAWKKLIAPLIGGVIVAAALPVMVGATGQSASSNYSVDQVNFGGGTQLHACSSSYCSDQTAGDLTVGNTKSSSYQANTGSQTARNEYLQLIVNATNIDTGGLSTSTPTTATATFSVKSYLAGGYVVVNASPPPQNGGGHTMATSTTAVASTAGTEQFGINVVANTTACGAPANYGANPVQVPSGSFSFGQAANGYNTCGQYKYAYTAANGNIIASSLSSSGETDYTISYIFNISPTTPAGTYTMNHVLVATSTF